MVSDVVAFPLNLTPSCFSAQIIVELGWEKFPSPNIIIIFLIYSKKNDLILYFIYFF